MSDYLYGVDVGGTSVKIGLFETDGTLLEKREIPTRRENKGEAVIGDIAEALQGLMAERGDELSSLSGIGIDVPGPILPGGIVNRCVNIGWGIKNVSQELSELMGGVRVEVLNDANAAALGEYWKGAGQGYHSLVMVTLGTGIGGGIVIDGRVIAGAHGAGGEIGHILVNNDEPELCNCGKAGCLEQYASATGIVRLAGRHLAAHGTASTLRTMPELTAKDIVNAARGGDELAGTVLEEVCLYLGEGLARVAGVVDPEVIVIGGGVSAAGEYLLEKIRTYFVPAAFHACRDTRFVLATLGNDAGIYGSAKMVLAS